MFGLDLPVLSTLLILASNPVVCTAKDVAQVNVLPSSKEIVFHYNYSSEELTRLYSNPDSPYPANYDTATGGLRVDKPTIQIQVSSKMETYTHLDQSCFWYDRVRVDIVLEPQIFVANDFGDAICKSEIKRHELKHIEVDRRVINKYSVLINESIHNIIRAHGVVGPVQSSQQQAVQEDMQNKIYRAVMDWEPSLVAEISRLQKNIDSLQEYRRINDICTRSRY
jgi:hypothetical protein